MNVLWSETEVLAALEAYIWMLNEQLAGRPFVKAAVIRELRGGPLVKRTKSSVEQRFQNLSSIFQERNLPWVKGYAPLGHVGPRVSKIVNSFLASATFDASQKQLTY